MRFTNEQSLQLYYVHVVACYFKILMFGMSFSCWKLSYYQYNLANYVVIFWKYKCLSLSSLAAIAKNRPVYYERILPVLLGFDPSLEVAKGVHPASLRYSLKTAFLGFLRSPCQAMIEVSSPYSYMPSLPFSRVQSIQNVLIYLLLLFLFLFFFLHVLLFSFLILELVLLVLHAYTSRF